MAYTQWASPTVKACGVLCALVFVIQVTSAKTSCFNVNRFPTWTRVARKNACGVSKMAALSNRIMGGSNADLGEFPWMARLFYRTQNETMARCGGSLIHEEYILTAAHCCTGELSMELVSVRLGEYDTMTSKDCRRGRCAPKHVDIAVDSIHSHDQYNPLEFVNDICLVKLAKKVKFSDYVYPVCLPENCKMQAQKFEHNTLTSAGWGMKDEVYSRNVDVLQKLKVETISRKMCAMLWMEEGMPMEIGDSQICAGREVGQDVCGGDSGGPLMYKSSITGRTRQYVVGLVSYGQPCSQQVKTILPGVYTNVASYLPWIFSRIG